MLIGSRLRQIRLSRGLTLDELASDMGGIVTKQAISKYESGKSQPSHVVLNKLSSALGIRASNLCQETHFTVQFHGFRKQSKLGEREQARIQSQVTQMLEYRIRLQNLYSKETAKSLPFKQLEVGSFDDIEVAANKLRNMWELGSAPISSVTDTLEEHRIHVLELNKAKNFDGLSATATDDTHTIIAGAVVTRSETAGERQRFTLAHELGHLVIKLNSKLEEEKVANRFAGALLAPKEILLSITGDNRHFITLDELLLLKDRFGISIQALLYRMRDLNIISKTYHKQWCIEFSSQGWRENEPGLLPREDPIWFKRTLLQAVTEDCLTKEDAEKMLGESLDYDEPLSLKQRRAFMKLPLEERRRILARQAKELAKYYNSDTAWKEGEGADFIDE